MHVVLCRDAVQSSVYVCENEISVMDKDGAQASLRMSLMDSCVR